VRFQSRSPVKELKGFEIVELKPGETKSIFKVNNNNN
jgi:hypothetical protein